MKTGPQPGKHGLTLKEIAAAEHVSVATVERTLNTAVAKLQKIPGAFSAIVTTIHAVDGSDKDPLQPGSVECCQTWIQRYGH